MRACHASQVPPRVTGPQHGGEVGSRDHRRLALLTGEGGLEGGDEQVALGAEPVVDGIRRYRSPVREASARETRRRVVEAAARCFTELGYSATTLRVIATEAG